MKPSSWKGPSCRENSALNTPLASTLPLNFNADCTDVQLCDELAVLPVEEVPEAPAPEVLLVPEVPEEPLEDPLVLPPLLLPPLLWATTMPTVPKSRIRKAVIAGK